MLGVALGGAVKNVLAIAAGIVEGRGLGHNAAAALVTRGFAEMARLGQAMGAELETLTGLSGLGDLVLTCHGPLSRNRSLGAALGKGTPLADYMKGRRQVVEGEATAPAVLARAARHKIEMPICAAVDAILHAAPTSTRRSAPCWRVRCGAKANEEGSDMAHWLIKSEPSAYSWDQLVKEKKHLVDRRAQLPGRDQSQGDEGGRSLLLLPLRRGQGDRRHRRGRQDGLSRSDRQGRQGGDGRRQGGASRSSSR